MGLGLGRRIVEGEVVLEEGSSGLILELVLGNEILAFLVGNTTLLTFDGDLAFTLILLFILTLAFDKIFVVLFQTQLLLHHFLLFILLFANILSFTLLLRRNLLLIFLKFRNLLCRRLLLFLNHYLLMLLLLVFTILWFWLDLKLLG